MNILALESSSLSASAAVCEDEVLIAQSFQRTGLTHSAALMPMVRGLLANAGLELARIDLLAVAAGPGSFTGLRIGVSALKGLAWALEKPCAPCSTLESMAWGLAHLEGAHLCPVMDARRGQVYNARFQVRGGAPVRLTPDRAVGLDQLAREVRACAQPQLVLGDGAALALGVFEELGLPARAAPPHLLYPGAWGVARCALAMAQRGELVRAGELAPRYHRLSQAERERLARLSASGPPPGP